MFPLFFPLCLSLILLFAVIFVNGWTDAPGAIATAVASRTLPLKGAILLAAAANLAGGLAALPLGSAVASTVFRSADFGGDRRAALTALSAAMCAVVLWAIIAWRFGLPTSESHALLAGLTGASLAHWNDFSHFRIEEWGMVALGLLLSTLPAYLAGLGVSALCRRICAGLDRRHAMRFFRRAQICGACSTAFCHGAQDGQKFMAILSLLLALWRGEETEALPSLPPAVCLICTLVMAAGTLCGGGRIIRTVGMKMVSLDASGGFAADTAATACLIFCTLTGLPVSTTHAKTCAMMGAGRRLNRTVLRDLALAWGLTFPVCGALAYGLARLML